MRKVLAFAVVATATLGIGFAGTTVKAAEPAQNIDISKMKVNWSDEFNGTELNSDHWTPEIGNGNWGWGNNEKEYYRANNISVSDGTMKIKAQTEKVGSYNWTSGRIKSAGKVNIGYGYVEARIKIPSSQGIWPAFWMLGTNGKTWPACGEIDIMEAFNTSPRHDNGNEKTQNILMEHPDLIATAGSDSHRAEDTGLAGIITERPICSDDGLLRILKDREYLLKNKCMLLTPDLKPVGVL